MLHGSSAWSLGLAGMVLGALLFPSEPGSAQVVNYFPLRAVGEPLPLERGYGLPLVKVRGVPPLSVRTTSGEVFEFPSGRRGASSLECPFEVRAIVASSEPSAGFAVLGLGAGESVVAGVAEKITFETNVYRLKSVESEEITLKRGGRTIRCPLQSRKR